MDVEAPFAAGAPRSSHGSNSVDAHGSSSSPVQRLLHARTKIRTGLLVTRCLQMLFALLMAIFSGIWMGYASKQTRVWHEEVIGTDQYQVHISRSDAVDRLVNACVVFFISLITLALAATWMVFTFSPNARSRASWFGNHTPCTRFTCDMGWDIAGAVVWLALSIEFIVFYPSYVMIAFSVILMVLYITASLLSGLQRQRVIHEEQQVQLVGTCGAAVTVAAPQQYVVRGIDANKNYI